MNKYTFYPTGYCGHKQPSLFISLTGFYFSNKTKKSQFPLETKPRVSLCPQIHFFTSLFPSELWFDALEAEPCLGRLWWELERGYRGIGIGSEQLSPNLASQWNQKVLPRKVHPDQTSPTAPPLSVLMEEAEKLERGIFSPEVEFHTFSEMIFQFLLPPPRPFFLLMVLGVSKLNQTWALNPGWSPEEQGLAPQGFGKINVKSLSLCRWNPPKCCSDTAFWSGFSSPDKTMRDGVWRQKYHDKSKT